MSPWLRQFMLVSIVGMTALLGSLLYFHLDLSRDYLKEHLSTHNRILAVVLRNSVLNDHLVVALRDDPDALSADLQRRLDTQLAKELRWVPIVKVKIYSADSTVLYSTKKEEVGLNASDNLGVLHALHGEPLSDLVRRNQRNQLDGSTDEIDLHQQYIPIKDPANGRSVGAFEIYTDVSGILEHASAKQRQVFWWIAGILGIFYLALARSFVHAHRLLQDERRQREAHLMELTEIKEDLERRVELRTAELDKSKNFLQEVIDGIGNPLLVIRSDFTIALMNRAARRLIPEGADPQDHRYCYQISHRRDVPCEEPDHPCSFAQVMNHGRPARSRHTHYDANNQPIIIDLLSTPLYAADGTFEGVIEVEHDVTQMVQMQAGLVESEARLQAIMDHVPDAILTCDPDCVIKSINSSALRLFNGSEDDLVGQAVMGFINRPDGECSHSEGETTQMEVQMRRIDGSYFPADVWIGPLDLRGETRYVAVVRDITARRQAQEELEKTRQQYFHQEKMAAIGHLAAGILHEVGNPIAAIAGAASELKTVTVGGQRQSGECPHEDLVSSNIDLIDTQATRLGKITREIADFASPRPRERELLDLNSLLRSTASLLTYDRRFRDVQLKLDLDHDLPAIVGVADQLTQVFMNLLINAMDACSVCAVGDPRILIVSAYQHQRVRVSVQDNGCGMSEETVSKVREPFYTTKPVGKGTGLGLSLCDSIALSHGGALEIESQEGQGTTVHLFLPLSTQEDDVADRGGLH